ncbi:GNAT family N-acetyltransferase [Paenibacillus sp. MZ04-78.2]|uniref:GNAT family N-acetyltransferase n=1 Tax=Paenibacillus sp. MZ04-78.2 TaxID=2962034 RepID=UPI0020B742AD|nr:GNAT family N-acetyltransferase [Paenibacillus sp. MZ04-78.2]MCP3775992.1 GNAT family N-acetyltransferase [Paenibacillus sp. MZ04-78.2]
MIRISSATEIFEVLKRFNDCFPLSIDSRVGNLGSYAIKLAEHAFVYVTQDNGEITGVVVFYANDSSTKVAYLSQIAVSVLHQNKGIGSLLLQFSCDLSKEYGMTKMKLEVDNSNSKAISHYEKHKFTIIGQASLDSQYMMKELT